MVYGHLTTKRSLLATNDALNKSNTKSTVLL